MTLRSRLPVLLLALVALALGGVIVMRVSAGADPAPEDTTPIVISSTPTDTPNHEPTHRPSDDSTHGPSDSGKYTQVVPTPRTIDDNGGHQSGKGSGGGGDDGGTSGGGDDSGNSGKGSGGGG
jgi:uncharacterized membrane protein YgcG